MLTTIRKPVSPPGTLVSRCSTQRSPLTARKIRPKQVEPIRMKTTKDDSLAVVSIACLSSDQSSRSEENTSELQSLMRISYAVFCVQKKNNTRNNTNNKTHKHRTEITYNKD